MAGFFVGLGERSSTAESTSCRGSADELHDRVRCAAFLFRLDMAVVLGHALGDVTRDGSHHLSARDLSHKVVESSAEAVNRLTRSVTPAAARARFNGFQRVDP